MNYLNRCNTETTKSGGETSAGVFWKKFQAQKLVRTVFVHGPNSTALQVQCQSSNGELTSYPSVLLTWLLANVRLIGVKQV